MAPRHLLLNSICELTIANRFQGFANNCGKDLSSVLTKHPPCGKQEFVVRGGKRLEIFDMAALALIDHGEEFEVDEVKPVREKLASRGP